MIDFKEEIREPKWAKLSKTQLKQLNISSYDWEVVLVDYSGHITSQSLYFNAQENFSQEELDKMPDFDVWLFVNKGDFKK